MEMFYDKIVVGDCNVILPNVLKPYSHLGQKGNLNHSFSFQLHKSYYFISSQYVN